MNQQLRNTLAWLNHRPTERMSYASFASWGKTLPTAAAVLTIIHIYVLGTWDRSRHYIVVIASIKVGVSWFGSSERDNFLVQTAEISPVSKRSEGNTSLGLSTQISTLIQTINPVYPWFSTQVDSNDNFLPVITASFAWKTNEIVMMKGSTLVITH